MLQNGMLKYLPLLKAQLVENCEQGFGFRCFSSDRQNMIGGNQSKWKTNFAKLIRCAWQRETLCFSAFDISQVPAEATRNALKTTIVSVGEKMTLTHRSEK